MSGFLSQLDALATLLPGLRYDLNLIAKKRKEPARDMEGVGRLALSIPEPAEALLQVWHPELYQKDAELRAKAWKAFIFHPDSAPFRTQARRA